MSRLTNIALSLSLHFPSFLCVPVCLCVLWAECSQWSRADILSGTLEPVSVRHHSAPGLYESRAFKQTHYLFSSGFVTHGAQGISYRCRLPFFLGRVKDLPDDRENYVIVLSGPHYELTSRR